MSVTRVTLSVLFQNVIVSSGASHEHQLRGPHDVPYMYPLDLYRWRHRRGPMVVWGGACQLFDELTNRDNETRNNFTSTL